MMKFIKKFKNIIYLNSISSITFLIYCWKVSFSININYFDAVIGCLIFFVFSTFLSGVLSSKLYPRLLNEEKVIQKLYSSLYKSKLLFLILLIDFFTGAYKGVLGFTGIFLILIFLITFFVSYGLKIPNRK